MFASFITRARSKKKSFKISSISIKKYKGNFLNISVKCIEINSKALVKYSLHLKSDILIL